MGRRARHIRFLSLVFLLLSLVAPLQATAQDATPVPPDEPPQPEEPVIPTTGGLHLVVLDEAGAPLPGGSFTITDAEGTAVSATDGGANDDDAAANGVTVVSGITAGPATVTQIGIGAGYVPDTSAHPATVIADVPDTRVEITNTPLVTDEETADTTVPQGTPPTVESTPGDQEAGMARSSSLQASNADIYFSVGNVPYPQGSGAIINITIQHHGGDPVDDFTLSYPLPTAPINGTWAISTDMTGACVIEQDTLTCDGFGLSTGGVITIRVVANVSADAACTPYTTTATLTWNDGDASRTDLGGITVSCPDNVTFTNTVEPATVAPGDDVTFTLRFNNTGEPIYDFELSDALPPGLEDIRWEPSPSLLVVCSLSGNITLECSALGILGAESVTIRITGTVASDPALCGQELTNTASATGTFGGILPGSWNAPDASVTVECDPGLDITTTATHLNDEPITPNDAPLPDVRPGDELTYAVDVENTGNVTLADISVADSTIASLAPGDTETVTTTSTLTPADLNAGQHTTCATASTTFQDQPVTSNEDCDTVAFAQTPALDLAFSAIQLNGEPVTDPVSGVQTGDVVTFTLTATNTGNVALSDLGMASTLIETLECTPAQPASLDPEGTLACTGTYTVTQDDIDAGTGIVHEATVSGTFAPPLTRSGVMTFAQVGEPVTATASITLYPEVAGPALVIEKTATTPEGEPVAEGTEITYRFTVLNPGNVTMDNVVIEDPLPGLVWDAANPDGSVGTLAPGDTAELIATYAVTGDDVTTRTIHNTATAIGDGPACDTGNGCGITSAPAEATITVAQPEPTPSPTQEPTPEPTIEPTPGATPQPSPVVPSEPTPTPAPGTVITSLPNTGAGSQTGMPGWGWAIGMLAAVVLVATAGITRRRSVR